LVGPIVCVNADDFSEFRVSNTRGHTYKLYQQSVIVNLDQNISPNVLLRYRIVSLEIVLILVPSINLNPRKKSTDLLSLVH